MTVSEWIFMFFGLIGGLGLFLYGMQLMSEGLQQSAGDKMRSILGKLTKNKFIGVGLGTFVTSIIQSSSATTVMLVGFVNAGLLTFARAVPVIFGAAIGTTITAQILAFKLDDYALLFIGIGFFIYFIFKNEKIKHIGTTILGFGILFFGMKIMSDTMAPLRSYQPFINFLLHLKSPVVGIIAGIIFTAIIQSSSAFIGILIILAGQGMLTPEISLPLVLGSNIGTTITAMIASINTNRASKKVAFAHFFIKFFGVLIFIFLIPELLQVVEWLNPIQNRNLGVVVPREIANAHTIFNIAITVLFLPFSAIIIKLLDKILPDKETPKQFQLRYMNNLLFPSPTLSLNLVKQEILHMGEIVQDMLIDILLPFITKEKQQIKCIKEKEQNIDFLQDTIKDYLIKINQKDLSENRLNEVFQMMFTIKELEQIGDIISLNLYEKAKKWVNNDIQFTEEGKRELVLYHLKTEKQISRALEVFKDFSLERAQAVKEKFKKYRTLAYEMERQHYERLKERKEDSIASSEIHLEILGLLKAINTHATNIVRIMIDWKDNQ
ncbi:MAG: Na/Pi cotransporter family protein [Bacteroidales bacterium]|nr:Na/Pi cotransporter family protein [Bacteroidales bacterium]